MGYKFQFITLGFHTQNIVFELPEKYKTEGMTAYSRSTTGVC